jgi:Tol biopolymer transport system component
VHRDLKPENVVVTRDGRAKVLDFGLARVDAPDLDPEGETKASPREGTSPGMLLGTVAYMSPEQARGRPADARSDVFALGAVLYEMLSGRRPFAGATTADTLSAILREDPPPFESGSGVIPPTLDRVVRRCLEKEPAERFQTARDVGFALEALAQTGDATTSTTALAGALAEAPGRPRLTAKSMVRAAALVALGILVATAAGWLLAPPRAPKVVNYRTLTGGSQERIDGFVTDGERVYFTVRNGSETRQVALAGGASAPLELPFSSGWVADVSKARSSLLMVSGDDDTGGWAGPLWSVPIPAGGARKLGLDATGALWSPDGQRLAFSRLGRPSQLGVARADGTEPKILFEAQAPALSLVAWSPDSRRLRFTAQGTDATEFSLFEIEATGGTPRRLFPGFGGAWSQDGRTFVFTNGGASTGWGYAAGGGAEGRVNLFAASEPPGWRPWAKPRIEQLTFGPMHVRSPAFGPSGSTLIAMGVNSRSQLMRYNATTTRFEPTLGGLAGGFLDYSWDGRFVAWVDTRDLTLWRSRSDGSEPLQLTISPMAVGLVRWSPDGRKLAFVGKPVDSLPRIYVIPSDGGAPEPVSPPETGQVWDPFWMPDGKTVGWGLIDAGGIKSFDLETRKLAALPQTDDLWYPKASRQGLLLASKVGGSGGLWSYDPGTGRREDLGVADRLAYPNFSRDGQSVIGCSGAPRGIYGFSLRERRFRKLADFGDLRPTAPIFANCWSTLDPTDAPIVQGDLSTYELYALDLEWR